ncbi:MAG: MarR family transcriptional regulator [Pseudomonadota bacterium]
MTTKKIEPPLSIGRHLNFATGRTNALCQQILDPYDLSLPQWVILSCLWREGDLTVGALAELVGTGVPATSRIIDRMVDRGLVTRRRHEQDGRVIVVGVTEKGQGLSHLSDFHERINAALFKGFSSEEREAAFDVLRRMQANAEKAIV